MVGSAVANNVKTLDRFNMKKIKRYIMSKFEKIFTVDNADILLNASNIVNLVGLGLISILYVNRLLPFGLFFGVVFAAGGLFNEMVDFAVQISPATNIKKLDSLFGIEDKHKFTEGKFRFFYILLTGTVLCLTALQYFIRYFAIPTVLFDMLRNYYHINITGRFANIIRFAMGFCGSFAQTGNGLKNTFKFYRKKIFPQFFKDFNENEFNEEKQRIMAKKASSNASNSGGLAKSLSNLAWLSPYAMLLGGLLYFAHDAYYLFLLLPNVGVSTLIAPLAIVYGSLAYLHVLTLWGYNNPLAFNRMMQETGRDPTLQEKEAFSRFKFKPLQRTVTFCIRQISILLVDLIGYQFLSKSSEISLLSGTMLGSIIFSPANIGYISIAMIFSCFFTQGVILFFQAQEEKGHDESKPVDKESYNVKTIITRLRNIFKDHVLNPIYALFSRDRKEMTIENCKRDVRRLNSGLLEKPVKAPVISSNATGALVGPVRPPSR